MISTRVVVIFLICHITCNTSSTATPQQCVDSSKSVDSLILCLQDFIAKSGSISDAEWSSTVPTDQQRQDWQTLIISILSSDNNCDKLPIPSSITGLYQLTVFADSSSKYCLLYETNLISDGSRFLKGWGIFMSRYSKASQLLNLHISAAHPFTDEYVQNEAANVFVRTLSASLIISGVERSASLVNSTCEPSYGYRTDGAHDNNTMFHSANYAIMSYQHETGCSKAECGFIQFHGKASSTCPTDSIFLSNGFGSSPQSLQFYNNSNLAINRLKMALRSNMPNLTINTPLESSCDLTAGSNVFGRLVNGVAYGQECKIEPPPNSNTQGYFIHAEQAIAARESTYYDAWALSIIETFGNFDRTNKQLEP